MSDQDTNSSFLGGLLLGLIISAPVAAWLTPRSGREFRAEIRQRGVLIRRKTEATIRKPLEAIQSQVSDLRGESVEDSLAEGKILARQRNIPHEPPAR